MCSGRAGRRNVRLNAKTIAKTLTRAGLLLAIIGLVDIAVETKPWGWPDTLDMNACPWGTIAFAIGMGLFAAGLMVTEVPLMLRDYEDE